MRGKLGTLLICVGAAMVLAAAALFSWNWRESNTAGELSDEVLPLLVDETRERKDVPADPFSPQMTAVLIDGYKYVGFLSLPTLELELPVMADWSEAKLKLSPCRYYGSVNGNDLVICAHNYARHFGRLTELKSGDDVLFTDLDGNVTHYAVAEIQVLGPGQVEDMTSGDYPLTLFTCTYGGKSRITVRCDAVG